ncbi:nuclear transport factor 2 family protein [Oryzifoliimicrobium ureilyticus]|uniref:nuclear transport factor 2 family protein n=1 Tax=Oryzifoliimicrobium ureilyticus TaxID=3113724 RepID=UPI003075F53A
MANPDRVARDYLALWNEPDPSIRDRRLRDDWTPDARYVDPLMTGNGYHGIAAMITTARAQFPGHVFKMRGMPDGHGPFVRFSWTLSPNNGLPIAGGTDIVRLASDERIAEVIGFLDKEVA